ncbi:MAG: GGDEF domain-containing protein [Desulfovibrio sp.]|jgi:diguanylate cyclase (GGDEF)-like protein|nr:GGDEF domain-containing protein [Desulfovibrio sp.]
MSALSNKTSATAPAGRNIRAKTFLLLLLLLFLCVTIPSAGVGYVHLANTRDCLDSLENGHLPGMLDRRRTLDNIDVVQAQLDILCLSEDAALRNLAKVKLLTIIPDLAFESFSGMRDFSRTASSRVRRLFFLRERAGDEARNLQISLSTLQKFGGNIARVRGYDIRETLQFDTAGSTLPAQPFVREIMMLCGGAPAADKDDCQRFEQELAVFRRAFDNKREADEVVHIIWKNLGENLRYLADEAAAAEFQNIWGNVKTLKNEISLAQSSYYLAVAALVVIMSGIILALRGCLLLPVSLAAEKLHLIHLGRKIGDLPPTRIVELQQLLDMVSKLDGYLADLAEYSDKLVQEKTKFEAMSMRDALTGVANRRNFDNRLAREHRGESMGILMIDVDLFKKYNDTLGHKAGDNCLVALASAMQSTLFRSSDALFRYGGEEFAVILENVTHGQALAVAKRMKDKVQSLRMPHPSSTLSSHVTISIGVAVARKEDSVSCGELVQQADKALYHAKNSGRNRICLYGENIGGGIENAAGDE